MVGVSCTRPLRAKSRLVLPFLGALLMIGILRSNSARADERGSTAVGMSGFELPLPEIPRTAHDGDLKRFLAGEQVFKQLSVLPFLGPLFNGRSCVGCHFEPALGGSGEFVQEIRVRNNPNNSPVHIFATDNFLRGGPQTQGGAKIFANGIEAKPLGCQITAPGCNLSPCQQEEAARTTFSTSLPICDPAGAGFARGDNCTAERQSLAVFGLGLVEAVADQTLIDLAAAQPATIRGTVKTLAEFGRTRVARFGWKNDAATLRRFTGMAMLNELGVTTPDFPDETSTCAQGQTSFGVLLDTGPDPEDFPDSGGRGFLDRLVDFMRALSPPPTLAQNDSARRGRRLFVQIGCARCHVESLETASDPAAFLPPTTGGVPISRTLSRVLANRAFHPFSDFLLHDMGALGDGITAGVAGPTMMRTPPLWGVRAKALLLHDGRAGDLPTAITLHEGQGKAAAQQFQALSPRSQQDLLNYLSTI
jgi:di-heme oxidoreductase (putative peroxidase)